MTFKSGLKTDVSIQANFSVGDPQQDTMGLTLQTLEISEVEVISQTSNLCVFNNTYIVGSCVL